MERNRIPTLMGAVGGVLILMGALVAFFLGVAATIATNHVGPILAGMTTGVVAGVVGLTALVLTYYVRGSQNEKLAGGVGMLVLGAVSWAFLMTSALAIAGSIVVFFGGLLFALEGLIPTVQRTLAPSAG